MAWWYLSFADGTREKGSQWLGAVYVQADSFIGAIDRAWELGINPGGEVQSFGPLDEATMDANTALEDRERLLNEEDLGESVTLEELGL